MSLAAIIWVVVVCLTPPTGGVDVIDNNINFFKTSQTKSNYRGIIIYDFKSFYQILCNQTFEAYKCIALPNDKIKTDYAYFPKEYNPDNYLKSFQCERNEMYYFICQRMLKTYKAQKGQTWYNFHLDNTSCSLDGIRILSGVNQVLENKHFIDVTVESVLFGERQTVESQGRKEPCSCRDPTSEPPQPSSRLPTTAPSTKASSVFTKISSTKVTSQPTQVSLLKTMKTSPTKTLLKIPTHSSYHTRPMTYMTTFTTENTRARSSSLPIDTKSSQSSRMEEIPMEHINCHADIPIYMHIIVGTLSFATVALLVLTVCLCLKLRKNNESENVLFKEEHGKVVEEAALNEYTNILDRSDK